MDKPCTVYWVRSDFRLHDNPALDAAVWREAVTLPVYIFDDICLDTGNASAAWLHRALNAFDQALRGIGSRLVLRQGRLIQTLSAFCKEVNADTLVWNRLYDPVSVQSEKEVLAWACENQMDTQCFAASLLFEPWELHTSEGKPYRVFTPFWRTATKQLPDSAPLIPAPSRMRPPQRWPQSLPLTSLSLPGEESWSQSVLHSWPAGETGASQMLEAFIDESLTGYIDGRDRPDVMGVSRLSPYLRFGEISPRQVLQAVWASPAPETAKAAFIRQLGWREFAYHLLYHFPHTLDAALDTRFDRFPWRKDDHALKAWHLGMTGYPIVDAGMRELWATGYMHNRVRMITASFLTKDLLLPWQEGAAWFMYTLLDADLANNTLGWQWTAGCGADAAPFFRVFNPVSQGKRFDPKGMYVRQWVPELAELPDSWVHCPWEAPTEVLHQSDIHPGSSYPMPIVAHDFARKRALNAWNSIR